MLKFRRFQVRYVFNGEFVEKYAATVAELEEMLAIPRGLGIGWGFRSVS